MNSSMAAHSNQRASQCLCRCSNLPAEICDIGEGSCSSDDHCGEVDKNDLSADDGCHEWREIDGGLKGNGDDGKNIKLLFQVKLKYASKSAETR